MVDGVRCCALREQQLDALIRGQVQRRLARLRSTAAGAHAHVLECEAAAMWAQTAATGAWLTRRRVADARHRCG